MSIKNYRFVSPGVFVNEIDNSQLPASPAGQGPVIMGRASSGPALRPVTVDSFEEFVNVFGAPAPGNPGGDVWREGNDTSAPTYGAYAAQAYLRNSSPLTYVRMLGNEAPSRTAAGRAGWETTNAWGLIVFEPSGSIDAAPRGKGDNFEGVLGAIFYAPPKVSFQMTGAVALSRSAANTLPGKSALSKQGENWIICDTGTRKQFNMVVTGSDTAGSGTRTITFNFNRTSPNYIRKVFNTNPQLTNTDITDSSIRKTYWLGESFDRHVDANITNKDQTYAAIVQLKNGTYNGGSKRAPLHAAQTPKIIACRTSNNATNVPLFHFVALGQPGDWTNRNIKISIQDIKRSTNQDDDYGTFSVLVRHLSDSDNVVRVIEQFDNCNLNPNSLNYVARKIGNQSTAWDTLERRYVQSGEWPNNSKYIRIVMNSNVDAGLTSPDLLPFGFQGISHYLDQKTLRVTPASEGGRISQATTAGAWLTGSALNFATGGVGWRGNLFRIRGETLTASVLMPVPELRVNASAGNLPQSSSAYFGYQTTQTAGGTVFDRSNIDLLRPRGGLVGSDMFTTITNFSERSITFTLDDISGSAGTWVSGSFIAAVGDRSLTRTNGLVVGVLDAGYDRFTVPMYGGFDGTDITQMDPFANTNMDSSPTDLNNYVFNSVKQAIDSVSDPEVVQMNMASFPGLTQEGLTTNLVRVCEDRGDSLAVIDLPDAFTPRSEGTTINRKNKSNTITTLVNGLRSRNLNSSYGCTYYPWVRARDTINGAFVWLPPSIPAIGTFSSSQRKTQVWFAPAGFNRGGLTEGSAGIPVVDVAHQLRRQDRDDLYTANINPIAKFPNEGIVIFGQKTLQVTPSALDRINVRRLMIFVKKRISQMASTLLFDPNVEQTWLRFKAQVDPFLANVKTNFGLSDYKVVLDKSTTTPELVDRNILYAQIFLKPTRAIEYIAIDFNISRTGASFVD
tara:strand:+ start:795 stop:3665 length:2871 start_codon:yes stop_codon:yes gene_type:complete